MRRPSSNLRFPTLTVFVSCCLAACGSLGGSSAPAVPPSNVAGVWDAAVTVRTNDCPDEVLAPAPAIVLVIEQSGEELVVSDDRGGSYSGAISGGEFLLAGGWTVERGDGCSLAVASAIHGVASGGTFSASDTLVAAPTDSAACGGLSPCTRTESLAGTRRP